MPTAYNMKGGGEHFDMSYNVLGVNRIYESRLVHIKTLKVKFRHLGEINQDAFFSFNTINGRYEELQYQPNVDPTIEVPVKKLDYSNWLKPESQEANIITPEFAPLVQDNSDLIPHEIEAEDLPF
jgi:twinkle protein